MHRAEWPPHRPHPTPRTSSHSRSAATFSSRGPPYPRRAASHSRCSATFPRHFSRSSRLVVRRTMSATVRLPRPTSLPRLAATNAAGTSGGVTASSISAPQPPEGPAHCHHAGVSYILSRRAAHVYTNQSVTWTVLDGMDGGSIIASGVYRARQWGTFRIAVGSVTNMATIVFP